MVKKTAAVAEPQVNGNPVSALVQSFKAARNSSTPIVAIETADPAATVSGIRRALSDEIPFLGWDAVRGLHALGEPGRLALASVKGINLAMTVNAAEALLAAERLPGATPDQPNAGVVIFMHNFHLQMNDTPNKQALWNLRDQFKKNKRMVVLLGPAFQLPLELSGDIIVLEEELPTRDQLNRVIDQQHKNAQVAPPDDAVRAAALDAIVGLATFTAEQVYAMSIDRNGINVPKLWKRKIKAVQNTPGLSVYQPLPGDTTLDELKGIDNVVAFMRKMIKAEAFNVIVFIDEMDKSLAGGMSDHVGDSGVSKDQVQALLTYINDTKSPGVLLAGIAGTGKTQLAKATGAASGKPVISLDLGGLKGGTVGQSEAQIRAALKVITATAEGKVLFIGTANRTTIFTPEMNRRFPDQFFYDLPTKEARKDIWSVYVEKNGLRPSQAEIPAGFDDDWTGAEIQRACERAALWGDTVVEAARFIIPQAVSHAHVIEQMRRESNGRFVSATYPGFYKEPVKAESFDDDGARMTSMD